MCVIWKIMCSFHKVRTKFVFSIFCLKYFSRCCSTSLKRMKEINISKWILRIAFVKWMIQKIKYTNWSLKFNNFSQSLPLHCIGATWSNALWWNAIFIFDQSALTTDSISIFVNMKLINLSLRKRKKMLIWSIVILVVIRFSMDLFVVIELLGMFRVKCSIFWTMMSTFDFKFLN